MARGINRSPSFVLLMILAYSASRTTSAFSVVPSSVHRGIGRGSASDVVLNVNNKADLVSLNVSSNPRGPPQADDETIIHIRVPSEIVERSTPIQMSSLTKSDEPDKVKMALLALTIVHFISQVLDHSGLLQNAS